MKDDFQIFFALESVSEDYGGPIRSLCRLQDMFHDKKINVSIIQASLALSLVNPFNEFVNVMTLWKSLLKLFGRVVMNKKSLVIFNNQWSFGVQLFAFLCFMGGVPYIWWVRGVPSYQKSLKKSVVWHFSQKWLMAYAQAIVGSSSKSLSRVKSQLPETNVQLIDVPNIINFPGALRDENKIKIMEAFKDATKLNLLSVGRLHYSKRFLELVKYCPSNINGMHVSLKLAGYAYDEEYIDSLIMLAHKKKLNVDIEKNVSSQHLDRLHEQADIFISLSKVENFGNAIGDALAFGLPVVINDETDFWPISECPGVFTCSDDRVAIALSNAIEYCQFHSLKERRKFFERYWRDYSIPKYNNFINLCLLYGS